MVHERRQARGIWERREPRNAGPGSLHQLAGIGKVDGFTFHATAIHCAAPSNVTETAEVTPA